MTATWWCLQECWGNIHGAAWQPQPFPLDFLSHLPLLCSPSSYSKALITGPAQQLTDSFRGGCDMDFCCSSLWVCSTGKSPWKSRMSLKIQIKRSWALVWGWLFANPTSQVYWPICFAYGQGMCVRDEGRPWEKWKQGGYIESKGSKCLYSLCNVTSLALVMLLRPILALTWGARP